MYDSYVIPKDKNGGFPFHSRLTDKFQNMGLMTVNRKILFVPLMSLFVISVFAQEVAPDFTLSDVDGDQFSLSDYTEKVVLLDFFATWCSDCISQIPHLKSLQAEFGEDLVIISISVSPSFDTDEKLRQFRQNNGIDWIVARDITGIGEEYNVDMIPELVIVDREGYIRHQHVGPIEYAVLREEIYEIMQESESPNNANSTNNTNDDSNEIVLAVVIVLAILTSSVVLYRVLSRRRSGHPK